MSEEQEEYKTDKDKLGDLYRISLEELIERSRSLSKEETTELFKNTLMRKEANIKHHLQIIHETTQFSYFSFQSKENIENNLAEVQKDIELVFKILRLNKFFEVE